MWRWIRSWFRRSDTMPTPPPRSVTITAEHLARGQRKSPWFSALALACNEQLGGTWCLQPPMAYQLFFHTQGHIRHPTRVGLFLSAEAIAFEEAWDRGEALTPQTLALNDPTRDNPQTNTTPRPR